MAEQASETQVYKLSVLAQRQHLPSLPGQEEGTTYGVVWSSFPMPAHGSCYVVKFNNARSISFLAYIDDQARCFLWISHHACACSVPGFRRYTR